jgi:hypothetical protein
MRCQLSDKNLNLQNSSFSKIVCKMIINITLIDNNFSLFLLKTKLQV